MSFKVLTSHEFSVCFTVQFYEHNGNFEMIVTFYKPYKMFC